MPCAKVAAVERKNDRASVTRGKRYQQGASVLDPGRHGDHHPEKQESGPEVPVCVYRLHMCEYVCHAHVHYSPMQMYVSVSSFRVFF